MKNIIEKLDMNENNIKLKNKASIITLFIELLKVILTLIFIRNINLNIALIIFIYATFTSVITLYIIFNDEYDTILKYSVLDLASGLYIFSNIYSGIIMEKILWDVDKTFIKSLFKIERIKKLKIDLDFDKKVYLYLFISIIILYEGTVLNNYIFMLYVLGFLLLFFIGDIKDSIKEFKRNYKKHINFITKMFFITTILSAISFILISLIVKEDTTNEILLNEEPLIELILSSIIYAPIAEELLFRGCLRKLIKNDLLFILISGILFGLWHVVGYDHSTILQYLYIIPYSIVGIILSYSYTKTNNLTTSMGVHFLNNFFATIGSI